MSKTKERIRDSQLRYKQGLGQNFIYDDTLLEELVPFALVHVSGLRTVSAAVVRACRAVFSVR